MVSEGGFAAVQGPHPRARGGDGAQDLGVARRPPAGASQRGGEPAGATARGGRSRPLARGGRRPLSARRGAFRHRRRAALPSGPAAGRPDAAHPHPPSLPGRRILPGVGRGGVAADGLGSPCGRARFPVALRVPDLGAEEIGIYTTRISACLA